MTLYRYVNSGENYWSVDFDVIRETKCFYFIEGDRIGSEKRVSKDALRRFAYPTEAEALFSFTKRKEKQIQILTRQMYGAEITMSLAKEELRKLNDTKN